MDCWCVDDQGDELPASRVKFGENPHLDKDSFSCENVIFYILTFNSTSFSILVEYIPSSRAL